MPHKANLKQTFRISYTVLEDVSSHIKNEPSRAYNQEYINSRHVSGSTSYECRTNATSSCQSRSSTYIHRHFVGEGAPGLGEHAESYRFPYFRATLGDITVVKPSNNLLGSRGGPSLHFCLSRLDGHFLPWIQPQFPTLMSLKAFTFFFLLKFQISFFFFKKIYMMKFV